MWLAATKKKEIILSRVRRVEDLGKLEATLTIHSKGCPWEGL